MPFTLTIRERNNSWAGRPPATSTHETREEAEGALREYVRRALELSPGKHTPHLLEEAFGWHVRYQRTGSMRQ